VFSAKALAHAGRAVLSQTAERRALQRDKRNGYFNAAQQSFAAWWKQAPVVAR
jgi:hypothetical protein